MDVHTHKKVLLMKNLHKFLNKESLPWIKLIWGKYYVSSPLEIRWKALFGGTHIFTRIL